MKVQILHQRDPDSACTITVWVDGVELDWKGIEIEDIDPGAGYSREDWDHRTKTAKRRRSAFGRALAEALTASGDSRYIT